MEADDVELFSVWLKRKRKENGLTQEEVAERIGDSAHVRVQRYEAGTRNVPFDVALQLADAMGITRSEVTAVWIAANGGPTDIVREPVEITRHIDPRQSLTIERYSGMGKPSQEVIDRIVEAMFEKEKQNGDGDDNAPVSD